MRANNIFKYFLLFIIFISFLVSLNVTIRRYQHENQKQVVEMTMSLKEIKLSAIYSGISVNSFLKQLAQDTSVSRIVIEETTLDDYINSGKVTLLKGSEVMNMHRVGHINRTVLTRLYKQVEIKPNYFYILVDEKNEFNLIESFLQAEFGQKNVNQIQNYNILEVLDDKENLLDIGLGINKDDIKLVTDYGFKPIFSLKNSSRVNPYLIKMKIQSFYNSANVNHVIFDGPDVLGYPSQLQLLLDQFTDKQIKVGLTEFSTQNGLDTLKHAIPHQFFRIHDYNTTSYEKSSTSYIINRYMRAARERKIDILFLHPFMSSKTNDSLLTYNINYLKELGNLLVQRNFVLQHEIQLPQITYFSASAIEQFAIIVGIISVGLILCLTILNVSIIQCIFLFLFFLLIPYGLGLFFPLLIINKLFALVAAILFPVVAIVTQFPQHQVKLRFSERFIFGCFYILKLLCVCLIGSIFIIGLLSDISFLKGIHRFAGIKLSFILPLILIGLFFYLRPQRIKSTFFVLKRLYYSPVRTSGLISIFALFIVLIIMIIRSGNLLILPQIPFEQDFRLFLEQLFFVRPRTKEFLLGYPFLLISFLYIDTKISRLWVWFFNILGSIALISVINSFCHLHTPLYISLYRTLLGMVLGIVLTLVYIGIFKAFMNLFFRKKVA